MAGSLYGNRTATDLGLMEYDVMQKGMQNYLQGLGEVGRLQQSPELQVGLGTLNTERAAMPDPYASFQEQLRLYNQGLAVGGGGSSMTRSSPSSGTNNLRWSPQQPDLSNFSQTQSRTGFQSSAGIPNYSNWQTIYSAPSNAASSPAAGTGYGMTGNQVTQGGGSRYPLGSVIPTAQGPTQDWYNLEPGWQDFFTPDFQWSEL